MIGKYNIIDRFEDDVNNDSFIVIATLKSGEHLFYSDTEENLYFLYEIANVMDLDHIEKVLIPKEKFNQIVSELK